MARAPFLPRFSLLSGSLARCSAALARPLWQRQDGRARKHTAGEQTNRRERRSVTDAYITQVGNGVLAEIGTEMGWCGEKYRRARRARTARRSCPGRERGGDRPALRLRGLARVRRRAVRRRAVRCRRRRAQLSRCPQEPGHVPRVAPRRHFAHARRGGGPQPRVWAERRRSGGPEEPGELRRAEGWDEVPGPLAQCGLEPADGGSRRIRRTERGEEGDKVVGGAEGDEGVGAGEDGGDGGGAGDGVWGGGVPLAQALEVAK
jgi:hypothetical protein